MKLENISNDVVKNLSLGNSFINEYKFYKYKNDKFGDTLSEKDNILLLIMAYRFQIIDLSFVLDLNPTDPNALMLMKEAKTEYNNLLNYFNNKYGDLTQTSLSNNNEYTYLNKPWIGDM